jgi:hypothetical protein
VLWVLQKSGPVGLLLTLTVLLVITTLPGAVGIVINDTGISPQQGSGTVVVRVVDCAGNPVGSVVIQLQSLTWDQWAYTNWEGVATLLVPAGTYTLQGGYGNFPFSETISVGAGGVTVTVNRGAGCYSFSTSTQTQYSTPIRPIRPR